MPAPDAFSAITPTTEQFEQMAQMRGGFRLVAEMLDRLPPSWYRDNARMELEASSMWANKAVTHYEVPRP